MDVANPYFQVPIGFEYLATFLWAVSGAIVGLYKRYDLAGVVMVALVASTGGGLLRDGFFLNRTPPMLYDSAIIPLIVLAALLVSLFRQRVSETRIVDRTISIIDAVGIPTFSVVGMQLSIRAGFSMPGVLLVGVINGVGGGLLRDILVGNTPAILRPGQFLISALFLVCILFLIVNQWLGIPESVAAWGMIGLYFVIRMLAIRYDLRTRPVLGEPEQTTGN